MDKKFHITITNNETGEKTVDVDTDAILAEIEEGDGTRSILFTECGPIELASLLCAAAKQVETSRKENPFIAALVDDYFACNPIDKKERKSIFNNIFGRR